MTKRSDKCTIYLLTNEINSKKYVGQSWYPLNIRMGKDGENYKNSVYLYNAIKKYGCDKFHYEILETCDDQEAADNLESFYIDKYESRNIDKGYNIKIGGSVGKHSEETKAKISTTMKERIALMTPEELANHSAPISGFWEGKERGPHTEEWKEQNSIRTKKWHMNNDHPMLGKHQSDNAVAKMSQATKEAWRIGAYSDKSIKAGAEARMMNFDKEQNIVKAYQNGKTIADIEIEFSTGRSSIYRILKRNNISRERDHKGWLGKKHSEETKQKMSEARKKYWEDKCQL